MTVSAAVAPDSETAITALSGGELVETTMADWLPGVVAAEMPASFAPEALRAQAVAARTYILQRMRGGAANHPEAGVCDQYTCCCARKDDAALREQWGADYAHNMARIRQAVTDTDGQYLTYGGQLIRAVFHASSAGATESSAALWSGDAPYLVSVSSPETAQDVPNYVSTAEIAADAVREAVLDSYPDCVLGDDPGTWFGTPVLDDSGRVARIPVGSETLTGAQVRALFSLRSAAFSVAYSGGIVHLHRHGQRPRRRHEPVRRERHGHPRQRLCRHSRALLPRHDAHPRGGLEEKKRRSRTSLFLIVHFLHRGVRVCVLVHIVDRHGRGGDQLVRIIEHLRRHKAGRAAFLDDTAVRHELLRVLGRTQELDAAVERHGDAPAGARGDAGRHVAEREDQPAVCHAERVETSCVISTSTTLVPSPTSVTTMWLCELKP